LAIQGQIILAASWRRKTNLNIFENSVKTSKNGPKRGVKTERTKIARKIVKIIRLFVRKKIKKIHDNHAKGVLPPYKVKNHRLEVYIATS